MPSRAPHRPRRRRALALLLCAALWQTLPAQGGEYPARTLRIIVPYPAGAFNDQFARLLGQHLQLAWGQPAVVENRPGGSTIIGTDLVAKAPADGHTILVTSFAFAVNPSLYGRLPFDTARDFTPVILAAQCPNVLVARSGLAARTLPDLLDAARQSPGTLNYASAGNGSSTHLAMELLKSMTHVDITHVPYKGSAPAVTDLLAGQVDVLFDNLPNALPHIRAGKLRALAVSSARRSAALPDVPTTAQSGVPGFDVQVWFGVVVRAGTPPAIIDKLNAEINRLLAKSEVKSRFGAQGVDAVGGSPADFTRYLADQSRLWRVLIQSAGIRPE